MSLSDMVSIAFLKTNANGLLNRDINDTRSRYQGTVYRSMSSSLILLAKTVGGLDAFNTAIDDSTRIRALKVYNKHTQINAINFIDYVINKFPFRIHTIQTDNGHEFQAKFHWHVEDLGMRHVYIKPAMPHLNGKVERSHGIDKEEFYQMLNYKNDVDLDKKIREWENFYNYQRPHGSLKCKTPYLRQMKEVA